ncbi:MAG TPA: BACON domain-containing carbohydrate-binding protein [Phycisphaerae bacterium]|nr:BACON domain-containing carbohydrate-binding protein [Phycisphaerae bacterium]
MSKTHVGNFTPGQNGATYTVTVSNNASPTSGTVTVTETVPTGLTLVSMAGSGWTCPAAANTCSRSDVLASGASYPPITVTVNVSSGAPRSVTNQVTVSGGGSVNATASDVTNVTCPVTVSPVSAAVSGVAGTLSLTLNGGSCGWTASSATSWLVPGASSGTSGTLTVSVSANTTGAQRVGTVTVSGQTVTVTQAGNNPVQIPGLVSLNPFQGTGLSATLTLVYSHPSGWSAIRSAEFIINPRWEANNRAGGCYIKYAPATNLFTLIADDGSSTVGTAAPGSATTLANTQCSLNAAASSATGSGTTLTIVAALTFQPSFSGQRHIWMQAVDYNNNSTNWLVYGVWFPTQSTVSAGPWYRIYDPFSATYLYSADTNEYNTLGSRGFTLQGTSGLVMNGSTTVGGVSNMAWYRVFVNSTSSHFWTSDRNEFLTLINQQQAYVGEGVAAFVMPYINAQGQVSPQVTNTIPFYRAAYLGANLHYWTADADEYFNRNGKHLPTGYVGEGIACYIFPTSGAQFNDLPDQPALASADVLPEPEPADDGSPAVSSVANGTSPTATGVIVPGQVISLRGRHLGGTVWINGLAAEVIAARDTEVHVVVPAQLQGTAEASLEVEHRGRRSRPLTLGVVPANPAIFGTNPYGLGNAQALNADGTTNSPRHPAARGSVVTLYTTGLGASDLSMEVHIAGFPAEVISAGPSVARPGVTELRVRVPEGIGPAAFQPVVLHIANQFSQPGIGISIE